MQLNATFRISWPLVYRHAGNAQLQAAALQTNLCIYCIMQKASMPHNHMQSLLFKSMNPSVYNNYMYQISSLLYAKTGHTGNVQLHACNPTSKPIVYAKACRTTTISALLFKSMKTSIHSNYIKYLYAKTITLIYDLSHLFYRSGICTMNLDCASIHPAYVVHLSPLILLFGLHLQHLLALQQLYQIPSCLL